jgi:peroxiredoxin
MPMKKKWPWIVGLGLGLLVIGYFVAGVFERPPVPGVERKSADGAPDFTLKDLEGKSVRLSDYRDRMVLLIFGTTWCTYCRESIPAFKDLHARYGPKGLVILNINIEEPREKVAAFARKYALPYPVLLDRQGAVSQAYGVRGVPARILIDESGRVVCYNCRTLDALLEKQFGAKPPRAG